MKKIAFIPVRGGSKSIPLKNIKDFAGKPLVYWSINAASECKLIDEVVVASDSAEIIDTVKSFSFDKVTIYEREPENAQDNSSTESVMFEYINNEEIDSDNIFVLIQATSPLICSTDLANGITLFESKIYDSILSCVRTKRFFWQENGNPLNYNFKDRPRRQDFAGTLMENGAFYINSVENILSSNNRLTGNIGIIEMPEHTSIELDEPQDWALAEKIKYKLMNRKKQKIKLFLSDVDGVLTDAGMYYSENGDEQKKFNTHDGMAFELLRNSDIKTGIITSENTNLVARRAKKLKVDFLYQGMAGKNKLSVAREICAKLNISLDEVAYIGDDVNCYEILTHVGCVACPSDAVNQIKSIPNINIMTTKGGKGCVREFVDLILDTHKIFP